MAQSNNTTTPVKLTKDWNKSLSEGTVKLSKDWKEKVLASQGDSLLSYYLNVKVNPVKDSITWFNEI